MSLTSPSPYITTIALVLTGIFANYLSVELIGELELILTPALLFVMVRILPLRLAIPAVTLVLLHLAWHWGYVYNSLLYLCEVTFYFWLCRKRLSPLSIDILYWLIVGVPLTAIILELIPNVEDGMFYITLAKQPINGIIYTLIASFLLWIPQINRLGRQYSGNLIPASIRSFFRDCLLLLFMIPTLAVVIFIKTSIEKNQLDSYQVEVANQAQQISIRIANFLKLYQTAIKRYAESYSIGQFETPHSQRQLESVHQLYSGFITMLIADEKGIVTQASPAELYQEDMSISRREYFSVPKQQGTAYMSDAFRGRGFGTDPIVAVSAPLNDENGKFSGIVEGSLNLYQFDLFSNQEFGEQIFLVVDKSQQVVFASAELELEFLQPVNLELQIDGKLGKLISLNSSIEYLYSMELLSNRWQVISLIKKSDYLQEISEVYFWLSFNLLISLIVGFVFAGVLSTYSIRPINLLLKKFKSMSLSGSPEELPSQDLLFEEFNQLIDKFDDAYRQLREAHEQEQQLVSEKLAAEKANESKSVFVSRVSHELRTPLNAILGNVQLIKMDQKHSDFGGEILEVERAGKHLLSIIDDLLQITKLDVGELKIEYEQTSINEKITDALLLMKELAESKHVHIKTDINDTQSVLLWIDPVRVQQVLINVINNSIKYNVEHGSVLIRTEISNNKCIISVKDSGVGIEENHHEGIFEPFQRLEQKHSHIEGSGLGLSLSNELVLLMNGKLWYQSEKDQGTTFFIEFPLQAAEEKGSSFVGVSNRRDPLVSLDLSGKKILYIEDNKVNYMIMENWLKRQEVASVDNCATGNDAKIYISQYTPDLIFLDLGLPDINGVDLAAIIKEYDGLNSVPLFALTADASSGVKQQCLAAGCTGFLTKPVDFDEISKVLIECGFYTSLPTA